MTTFKHQIPFILLCFLLSFTQAYSQNNDSFDVNALPLLGNSDQHYLTRQQANEIGNAFYNQAMVSSILIDDIEINLYLRSLITRLHNTSQFSSDPIRIIIINNNAINAFALPGNIIVIHSGLFLAVQQESELVGVLAHELSHLKQQHLLRLFAQQKKDQPKLLLSILAALLVSKDAQSSNAILMAGVASSVQGTLDYTRRQEYEADRIAINILVKANFNPEGISNFFELLAQKSGFSTDLASGSEFLRTHPLSENRIAEAKNRIQNIDTSQLITDSARFQRLKSKLAFLLNLPITNQQQHCYHAILKSQKLIINGLNANDELKNCGSKKIKAHAFLQYEYANLLSLQNNKNAEQTFKTLITNNPEHLEYQYSLLQHYYFVGDYQQYIYTALIILQNAEPLFPSFYQTLSHVYFKNQQTHLAKYYLSTYYIGVGKNSLAKRILNQLKALPTIDPILKHKVQTLIASVPDSDIHIK